MVRDGRVKWRSEEPAPPSKAPVPRQPAGFVQATGGRLEPHLLVALWELRHAHLITVDGAVVLLTVDGRARLSEWDATRAGVR